MKKLKFLVTTFLVTLITATMMLGCGGGKTIDLTKYAIVTVEGANGYGKASIEMDWDKLSEDNADVDNIAELVYFSIKTDIETENNGNLSNGDTVTYSISVPESLGERAGCKIVDGTGKTTVSGLEEIEVKDIFAGLKVTMKYKSIKLESEYPETKGYIKIRPVDSDDFVPNYCPEVGEEIIIFCTLEKNEHKIFGFNIDRREVHYVVSENIANGGTDIIE